MRSVCSSQATFFLVPLRFSPLLLLLLLFSYTYSVIYNRFIYMFGIVCRMIYIRQNLQQTLDITWSDIALSHFRPSFWFRFLGEWIFDSFCVCCKTRQVKGWKCADNGEYIVWYICQPKKVSFFVAGACRLYSVVCLHSQRHKWKCCLSLSLQVHLKYFANFPLLASSESIVECNYFLPLLFATKQIRFSSSSSA